MMSGSGPGVLLGEVGVVDLVVFAVVMQQRSGGHGRKGCVAGALDDPGTASLSDRQQAARLAAILKLKNVEAFIKRVMTQQEETQRNAPLVVR